MSEYKRPEWINKAPIQFQEAFEKHDRWVKYIDGAERANLRGANLQGADLRGAILQEIDLREADLREANLWEANLQGADLQAVNLQRTDLQGADLQAANLQRANLQGANLQGLNLQAVNLRGANLQGANLQEVDLREADLREANLWEADLRGANLREANLRRVYLMGADLLKTNIKGADLSPIKKDFFDVLLRAIPEIPLLKQAIVNGEINGSTYKGECACLCGTIEKSGRFGKICDMRDSSRPIERFFMAINPGDTPENSQFSKLALQWIEEFEAYINVLREI